MSEKLEQLRQENEQAHADLYALQAKKDEAHAALYAEYREPLREAQQRAADAQKAMCDREAAEALLDRPEGEAIAASLGLELPTDE